MSTVGAAVPSCHHAELRCQRHRPLFSGVAVHPLLASTRYAPACECSERLPACLRRLQAAKRNAAKQQASGAVRWRMRRGVKCSGLKRTESGMTRGGSLRMSVRSHAPEQARSTVCRRFVRAAPCGVCCRRCEPHRPNRDEARTAKLSASEARPVSDTVLAQQCLACLATEMCRECSGVVAESSEREAKRNGRAGSGRRVRPDLANQSRDGAQAKHARGSGLALQSHSAVCGGWPV
jgi:hypothetical protein